MNYYIKGDKERAEEIKAAFEKKGVGLPIRRSCTDDGLIYFLLDGEVFSITIKAIGLFEKNPDYKELELLVEPKFKAEDRIVNKSDKSTIYRIITLHEERREYVVEIEHKDYHESYPWIAFEDQDDYELAPKPHYDIANFKPFDKVLTRDTEHGHWNVNLFSYYIDDEDVRVIARFRCINSLWHQCIPFNDDTKHLLGTTDMCPEEYINW